MIGALGGAWINRVFIEHFQNIAEGHFTIRRLERRWGTETVQAEYRLLAASKPRARNPIEQSDSIDLDRK